jgi:3-oxoadipate enol-lactonase
MPLVRIRDIEIYYEIHGSGPRLFFIGGSGGDLRDEPNVFDGPLTKSFEVLSFDRRGLGRTDAPEGPYTMADYGEDAAALLEVLDFAPCLVMGPETGGYTSIGVWLSYNYLPVVAKRGLLFPTPCVGWKRKH